MKTVNVMRRLGSLAGLATVITLAGAAAVSAQPPASPKPAAEAIPRAPVKVEGASPQGYSVVLVLGDMQGTSATDGNVPAAARKALADMKDFLPYKSYRLLDAQWILGSQKTISRLRGANDQEYELTLRGIQISGGKLNVTFRLAEPGALLAVKPSPDAESREKGTREAALKEATIRAAHAVIDTTFAMDVGETVVVGTSRVAGEKALIALLTAVAQPGR